METSLHRALKDHYASRGDGAAQVEVALGDYRIDVVADDLLVEVQHGSLSAIRDKVGVLLKQHRVLVVKPIVAEKLLVRCDRQGGRVVSRRRSPKRGTLLSLFDELVYFTKVFPHPRLQLEVPLVSIEEWRYPGHGRRRRHRENDFQIDDQKLVAVHETHPFRTAGDLLRLLPCKLPTEFHSGDLAEAMGIDRWVAQRIAYCLRQTGAVRQVGKQGNAVLYRRAGKSRRVA
ncbi:MAG: hypothetical protein WEA31_00635 [Pirellulales bacterium]